MTVLEIATFRLRPDASVEAYLDADRAVEQTYVTRQPGFLSREVGAADDGSRVVAVHWTDAASADASMASFTDAPATADFMALVDGATMVMTRYTLDR